MIPLVPRKMKRNNYNNSLLPSSPSEIEQVHDLLGGKKETSVSNNGWRRYGIERRRLLIETDRIEGGMRFELNFQCRIQGYFALADKIMTKFDESFADESYLEATYVMGHRLCHFLTEALPRHPSYMKRDPVISRLREKSFQSLVRIKKKIDAISLRIDEEELNKYILHDFDPFADDDDSCSSSSDGEQPSSCRIDGGHKEAIQWESFDGWSFDLPPRMTQPEMVRNVSALTKDLDESADTDATFSSSEISFQDSSSDQEPIYSHGLEFLKQISSEAVRYETDSEAADSWAQEYESEFDEGTASSDDNTYDPARIALKTLMMNKQLLEKHSTMHSKLSAYCVEDQRDDSKENQSLDFDLSPDNTFDSNEEEDIWIAFDPTARLPDVPSESMERVSL